MQGSKASDWAIPGSLLIRPAAKYLPNESVTKRKPTTLPAYDSRWSRLIILAGVRFRLFLDDG